MSAAEEIEAAIAKLTEQRDDAKPGPWTTTYGSATVPAADDLGFYDMELIVTLHGTIDAQLMILKHSQVMGAGSGASLFQFSTYGFLALALARAINGPTS